MNNENKNSNYNNSLNPTETGQSDGSDATKSQWDNLADNDEKGPDKPETRESLENNLVDMILKSKKARAIFAGIIALAYIASAATILSKHENVGVHLGNEAGESAPTEADPGKTEIFWINDEQMYVKTETENNIVDFKDVPKIYGDNEEIMKGYNALIDAQSYKLPPIPSPPDELPPIIAKKTPDAEIQKPNISIEDATSAINQKIDQISESLNIHESDDPIERLRMCTDLQKYIAFNNKYTDDLMDIKAANNDEDLALYDLYYSVVENKGVCTSNSLEMCAILRAKAGIDAKCVALVSKEGNFHMATLIDVAGDGEYYYFDPTLEGTIFHEQCGENASQDEMMLCCAGLGKQIYEEIYEPLGIVDFDSKTFMLGSSEPLPSNISEGRIPVSIVNQNAQ